MSKLIYLACPYTSQDQGIQHYRADAASIAAAKIMATGHACFSPLTHGHALAQHLPLKLLTSHQFWMDQCYSILRHCDEVWVLPLEGWRDSKGVEMELRFAQTVGLSINIIQDKTGDVELLTLKASTLAEAKLNNWGILWL